MAGDVHVVFVGDAPSKTNTHPDVAFVGSRSLKTLKQWISSIEPDYYVCVNSSPREIEIVRALRWDGFKVVALGDKASIRLQQEHLAPISHFKLPHPSGLNRKLNDKERLQQMLEECYEYVRVE